MPPSNDWTLTRAHLKSVLIYHPDTGVFYWRVARGRVTKGHVAGNFHSNGYIVIKYRGRSRYAHRLAYLYMTGEWPSGLVRHINAVPDDNRWVNLFTLRESNMTSLITADILRQTLTYNPQTGDFHWRKSQGSIREGDIAGSEHTSGYIRIKVNGESHVAHRLAVLYMNGDWPEKNVSHLNSQPADNRWANLRDGSEMGSAHWRKNRRKKTR